MGDEGRQGLMGLVGQPGFWLLATFSAIAGLHLTLFDRAKDADVFPISLLFWIAAGSLIWDKRRTLSLESGIVSSLLGALLLAIVLLRSTTLPDSGLLLRTQPLIAVLGLGLLASDRRGLKQYWKELMIFGLLALYTPFELILKSVNLPVLTAQVSGFLLGYLGFQVQRQGVFLALPTGRVEVHGGCSGIHSILFMVSIGVLFLLMFPLRSGRQRVFCIGVAALIGFWVNAGRVALMTILVAFAQKDA
ncbi:MAG: cyanoexosortase A, partial [Kovacikia sp.]